MPSVVENRVKWSEHKWDLEGHEWSPGSTRDGTELLWWRSILPRVHAMLPAGTVLEIAPGFGRWTSFLIDRCTRLIAVDLTPRCIEVCRERFAAAPHAEFWVNDGETLPMVGAASIDFAFSFDSLVHVEATQIRAYLHELSRKLRPGASGFFHHSNLGAYAERADVPAYVTKRHWRAASMSSSVFREACREAGLICVAQEVINWIGRGARADRHRLPGELIPLTDCFSTFVKPPDARESLPARVYVNRHFVDEWRQLIALASLYGGGQTTAVTDIGRAADSHQPPRQRSNGPLGTLGKLRMLRMLGVSGTATALGARVSGLVEPLQSKAAERATGRRYARREPIVRSLLRGRCPDCRRALVQRGDKGDGAAYCRACHASFLVG